MRPGIRLIAGVLADERIHRHEDPAGRSSPAPRFVPPPGITRRVISGSNPYGAGSAYFRAPYCHFERFAGTPAFGPQHSSKRSGHFGRFEGLVGSTAY